MMAELFFVGLEGCSLRVVVEKRLIVKGATDPLAPCGLFIAIKSRESYLSLMRRRRHHNSSSAVGS